MLSSPTHATSHHAFVASPTSVRGVKRSASSSDEHENGDIDTRPSSSRRNTAVKRACNECRQQKLKCNVQQDPFVSCARCTKQNLRCVIEPNFKRIGKRNRNAEMEREMEHLRERLAFYEGRGPALSQSALHAPSSVDNHDFTSQSVDKQDEDAYLQHQQVAATSLLDLRSGSPMFYSLGNGEVRLSPTEVNELFTEYFSLYHPFLPFLDQLRTPEEYLSQDHKLLFWTIIAVAARRYSIRPNLLKEIAGPLTDLVWESVRNQPNHHVAKALCLLCTWPLPADRTATDQTYALSCSMMAVAHQIGLHQPNRPEDFQRARMSSAQEQNPDRLRTWAVCNIVAQTVCTGNGQPSNAQHNSALAFNINDEESIRILGPLIFVRIRQERAAEGINRQLYTRPIDYATDTKATLIINNAEEGLREQRIIEGFSELDGVDSDLEDLFHCAVVLHFRLFTFFKPDHREDLTALYSAATTYLDRVFKLQREGKLSYAPYYVMQMVLAAGFALLKLLNCDVGLKLPFEQGRQYVLQTVEALRRAKVWPNDLLDRFAEVLAQLWRDSSRGHSLQSVSQSPSVSNSGTSTGNHNNQPQHQRRDSNGAMDGPLELRITSRMSMSVLFDCTWRWRSNKVSNAAEELEGIVTTNPTNPDSSPDSTPQPAGGGIIENPAHSLPNFNPYINTLSMPLQVPNGLANDNDHELFDSMFWMGDGQPEWAPYGSGGFGSEFNV